GESIETRFGPLHTAGISDYDVIGQREVDYSIAEQHHVNAQELLKLQPLTFYVRRAGSTTFASQRYRVRRFPDKEEMENLRRNEMFTSAIWIDLPTQPTAPAAPLQDKEMPVAPRIKKTLPFPTKGKVK